MADHKTTAKTWTTGDLLIMQTGGGQDDNSDEGKLTYQAFNIECGSFLVFIPQRQTCFITEYLTDSM